MDSMRNEQFVEQDRDGIAVERPADLAAVRGAEVAVIDSAHGEAAIGGPASRVGEAPVSADPLTAYLRNLDGHSLLSREEELALAKQIDAAQTALLSGLCRIPLIVERIGVWADDLREGRIRASFLLDSVPSPQRDGAEDGSLSDGDSLDAETVELPPQVELASALGAELGEGGSGDCAGGQACDKGLDHACFLLRGPDGVGPALRAGLPRPGGSSRT